MNIKFTHLTKNRAAGTIDSKYFEALWLSDEGWHMPWWLNEARQDALRVELNRRAVMGIGGAG